ncbi:MAG: hypothetical protein MUP99_02805, partial [Pedobacter sp.]|nr:hypothetical protein [Pedobacter sp.]
MTANDELLLIMERVSNSTASDDEIARFNSWCDSYKGHESEITNLEEIQARILTRIQGNIVRKPWFIPLYVKRIAVAAVAVMVIGTGIF